MRSFLLGLALFSVLSSAQATTESLTLTPITRGQYSVEFVQPRCVDRSVCVAHSTLVLRLPLVGCADNVYATYKIDASNVINVADISSGLNYTRGKIKVFVSAINIPSRASQKLTCISAPSALARIDLGAAVFSKENVEVIFVNELATR